MTTRRWHWAAGWTGILVLGAGCELLQNLGPENLTGLALLEANRARWRELQVDDYEFEFQQFCFCPEDAIREVAVVVQDGEIASLRYTDDGATADESLFQLATVEALFDEIATALLQGAELVQVTYDPDSGYPTAVEIDNSSTIADEERQFTITRLMLP
jgi:Family of unknown function (DUF6174)